MTREEKIDAGMAAISDLTEKNSPIKWEAIIGRIVDAINRPLEPLPKTQLRWGRNMPQDVPKYCFVLSGRRTPDGEYHTVIHHRSGLMIKPDDMAEIQHLRELVDHNRQLADAGNQKSREIKDSITAWTVYHKYHWGTQ